MFYLGIDVGKNNHEAGFIREDGSHVGKSLRFPNSQDGFDALSAFIISRLPENESFCIDMEATERNRVALYSLMQAKNMKKKMTKESELMIWINQCACFITN
mgnify:CR=1 FL=1